MIAAFGEALLRLTPPVGQRLEQVTSLNVEVGGAELNTAVGLVRLGHEVAWLSRVPDSPLGELLLQRVNGLGIDTSHVSCGEGRQGIYFLEEGAAPRASSVLYDRADSSFARLRAQELQLEAFRSKCTWLHLTGISAAVNPDCTRALIFAAKAAEVAISFDLNYRSKLWSTELAGRVMGEMIPFCDLIFASETDARQLFDIRGEGFTDVAEKLAAKFHVKAVATMHRKGLSLRTDQIHGIGWRSTPYGTGETIQTPPIDVEVVDRIGTGDAFAAGVIDGMIANDLERGLRTGVAIAALAHTIRGDLPLVNRDEVDAIMMGVSPRIRR